MTKRKRNENGNGSINKGKGYQYIQSELTRMTNGLYRVADIMVKQHLVVSPVYWTIRILYGLSESLKKRYGKDVQWPQRDDIDIDIPKFEIERILTERCQEGRKFVVSGDLFNNTLKVKMALTKEEAKGFYEAYESSELERRANKKINSG